MNVLVENCTDYHQEEVDSVLKSFFNIFQNNIKPGDMVVIKPNWLAHRHKEHKDVWQSVITHPVLITAVLKIVLNLLNGDGRILIADAPQTDSSWKRIMKLMNVESWSEMGKKAGIALDIVDLRDNEVKMIKDVVVARKILPGDPNGSVEFDLKSFSEFRDHLPSKLGYYGADYNKEETNRAHSDGHHRYRISRSVVDANVFINLPKLKTHKKAGITCCLKNLVGINTYKNFLPHHNEGTPNDGGDQYPTTSLRSKTERLLITEFRDLLNKYPGMGKVLIGVKNFGRLIFGETKDIIRNGNWYGNDTLWRMVLDLNKILLYGNSNGNLISDKTSSRKRYISIVDGIISGEGNGPEAPIAKKTGLLIAGTNPVTVDAVCAKIMGFNWQKIPAIKNAFNMEYFPICDHSYEEIQLKSSMPRFNKKIIDIKLEDTFKFKPHFGWQDYIEI